MPEKKEYSMFYPKSKLGLKSDYPELASNPIFESLSNNEMLYVWYYACKASPFSKEDDLRLRADKSVMEAFGPNKGPQVRTAYLAGNYSEKVRAAIIEMTKFQIGPRIRAKLMIEKIIGNYEELIDINTKSEFINKDGDVDWTKKKAYIDACATVSKNLGNLINQAEGSFGVQEKEEGDVIEIDSQDLIDSFHETQQ